MTKIQRGVTATPRTGMCQVKNSKLKDTTESQDYTGLERLVGRVQGRVCSRWGCLSQLGVN